MEPPDIFWELLKDPAKLSTWVKEFEKSCDLELDQRVSESSLARRKASSGIAFGG